MSTEEIQIERLPEPESDYRIYEPEVMGEIPLLYKFIETESQDKLNQAFDIIFEETIKNG